MLFCGETATADERNVLLYLTDTLDKSLFDALCKSMSMVNKADACSVNDGIDLAFMKTNEMSGYIHSFIPTRVHTAARLRSNDSQNRHKCHPPNPSHVNALLTRSPAEYATVKTQPNTARARSHHMPVTESPPFVLFPPLRLPTPPLPRKIHPPHYYEAVSTASGKSDPGCRRPSSCPPEYLIFPLAQAKKKGQVRKKEREREGE